MLSARALEVRYGDHVAVRPLDLDGGEVRIDDEPTSDLDAVTRKLVVPALCEASRGGAVVVATHEPEVARALPRTVTIRDGRIGGEGRHGEEIAVVTADGFLPLPAPVVAGLPPGTLVSIHRTGDTYEIRPVDPDDPR